MAFIATVSDESASAPVAELFEGDRAIWGYVLNFARTFCLRPDVYRAWKQLNGAIKATMDPRRYELATLAAASALRSTYCSLAHGQILAERFLPPDDVVRIVTAPDTARLDPTDRVVVEYAAKVALHADQVTEEDVDDLRAHGLTDEEILDVTLAAAARCFFSKTLDATGTPADPQFRDLEPHLRDALTVGRPIAPV